MSVVENNIVRTIRQSPEFKSLATQFRDDLVHQMAKAKKRIKEDRAHHLTNVNKLCGIIVGQEYKAMLLVFCPDLLSLPVRKNKPMLMFGLPVEDAELSTIEFIFTRE